MEFLRGLSRNTVEEQKTQDDTEGETNVIEFAKPIKSIEIYHDEDSPQEFIVNGITLLIASGGWRSPIGGTPSDEVTIPEGVDCIITRLV